MADVRIIALDLDGTLLDSGKNLSAANRDALAAAAEKGIHIVPTTGRFFGGMPESVRELPFVRYAITVNGAQVYDRMTASMQARAADYAPDAHYLKMIRELRKPYPDLKAHLEEEGRDVQKIMLFARDLSVRAQIADGLKARFPELAVSASTFNNLELNSANAHKGLALKRFAEHLGLGLENCMAFGDGANDLTMIQAAGIGVAMSNACPEVLAAADYVTLSNDEDGVAAALAHFRACAEGRPVVS